ncbi:MAG: tRNA uridine-5-carboxymethylaminomethyl(34) synthesis GTPase MnmE, partial [Bacillota bacterium]|nr:tRNA uridine-5-carboxymethylaminomethyl(34) synthesis GTPase MnmE [Bacillota bacterium]
QAEAVIDMIRAKTDKSFDVAISQLEGDLSGQVKAIRGKLLDLLVDITVNIDYPDEDIEELTYERLGENILSISDMIEKLLSTAATGRMIREGIRVAIVGKPNVGKSSLMNNLLREQRAIVTEIPGTTRDTIEEVLNIRNIPVYLVDTAGIRETSDKVERLGIEKSKEAFNQADFVILILDGSSQLSEEDETIMEYLKERKCLVLINKQDLGQMLSPVDVAGKLPKAEVIETSLISGEGVSQVEDAVEALVYGGEITQKESMMVNNVRHIELLHKAKEALEAALEMSRQRQALDFIEIDVKNSYDDLGEIIGETVSDEIIDEVFARFCLGK